MKEFYDEFSPFYHLIFDDWNSSIQRHAKIIDQIIRDEWGFDHITLVDVSCGIGTQTIGLAQLGYAVDASDISPKAIKRAQSETEKRNLAVKYSVADMRQCYKHHQKQFDVLISCDNSVPHLLSDSEILVAFKEFYNCLKPEGGCIITLRDYENEKREGVQVKPYEIKVVDAVKSGAIRKFFVMAGCDGRMKNRDYYTEFADTLPKDTVILTAGCAKYRYNKLPLGDINGIPRVLDAGQCNDSYSLAVIALKLKEIFELNDINDLPIEYNIA